MNLAISIAAVVGIVTYALAALGFGYHAAVTLRSGSAAGLGWKFLRDTQPARFWTQVVAAFLFSLYFLLQIAGSIWAISRIL